LTFENPKGEGFVINKDIQIQFPFKVGGIDFNNKLFLDES